MEKDVGSLSRPELIDLVYSIRAEYRALKKDKTPRVTTEQYQYKVVLDKILEFLHKWHKWDYWFVELDDTISVTKHTLVEFQKWVCRKIDECDKRNNVDKPVKI